MSEPLPLPSLDGLGAAQPRKRRHARRDVYTSADRTGRAARASPTPHRGVRRWPDTTRKPISPALY